MAARSTLSALLLTTALGAAAPAAPPLRPWEDVAVFAKGQQPPRATFVPFASVDEALTTARGESPFTLSLNGTWRFHWAPTPEAAPGALLRDVVRRQPLEHDRRALELGDGGLRPPGLPQRPPALPRHTRRSRPSDDNPVGSYRRTFTLPEAWRGRRVLLHFEAVKSAFTLWVNGREVGYNEGGFEPAEFDVTPYRAPGREPRWPSRCCATPTAPTSSARTCGGSRASSATSTSEHARRCTSATLPSSPTSTRPTATRSSRSRPRSATPAARRRRRTLRYARASSTPSASPSSRRRSSRPAACRPARRAPVRLDARGREPAQVDGRDAEPLRADPRARRRPGRRDRGRLARGSASARSRCATGDPRQRRRGEAERRQQPHAAPAGRQPCRRRDAAPRPRADEAVQRQHRAHLPLPAERRVPRPRRRARGLRRRRGRRRVPRHRVRLGGPEPGATPTCTACASSSTATATTRASSSGARATRAAPARTSRP